MRVPLIAFLLVAVSLSAQSAPPCVDNPVDLSVLTVNAESGDPKAQLELGRYYYETRDPEKLPTAAYWLQKAADQGNADGEWRLAGLYQAGEGVVKDDHAAREWFNKAVEHQQPDAESILGMNYRDGRDVERDPQKAFDWFMRAAKPTSMRRSVWHRCTRKET